jgi:hypothetical protein
MFCECKVRRELAIARSLGFRGISMVPTYSFENDLNSTQQDPANATKNQILVVVQTLQSSVMAESEARNLSNHHN